jgi:hypothetical protein
MTTARRRKGVDFLDKQGLLDLDIDEETANKLLRASQLTGHDDRPVIEAERLLDLLSGAQPGRRLLTAS